jgi:hypothetical protein
MGYGRYLRPSMAAFGEHHLACIYHLRAEYQSILITYASNFNFINQYLVVYSACMHFLMHKELLLQMILSLTIYTLVFGRETRSKIRQSIHQSLLLLLFSFYLALDLVI